MSTGSSTQVTRRGVFPRLRDARIRAKLALILFVPLVAVIALAGVSLVEVAQRATQAGKVQQLTKLGTDISQVTALMHAERVNAAEYLAGAEKKQVYLDAIKATDAEIQTYFTDRHALDDVPDTVLERLDRIDDHLNTMDTTRSKIEDKSDGIAVAEAVSRYTVVLTDLVSYGDAVSQYAGDGTVADGLRALAAFAKAKEGTADQEAISYAAETVSAATGSNDEQRNAFVATQTSQQEALQAFSLAASASQQNLVNEAVTGDAVNLADQISIQLSRGEHVAPADVASAFGAVVDLMRWAEQQLEDQIVQQAASDRDTVVQQAAVEAILVVLVLAVAIALAVILANSLNLSLRRLREGALQVANRDLPDAVARLRDSRNIADGGVEEIVREIRDPIRLTNRDEVGQVAQAFNVVHREAVRIAAEQAALRTSVSAMFLNLARRSQALVDRMIGELDTIERSEEDPKRLARLFELDHLATRMRRNDENLLVLAGADSSAPRREDALLVDALRASQSEVELYNRIEFGTVDTDIAIVALAVNDVVRLCAELLDNATRFSPPTTVVVAEARRIRDYVVIQIEDRGLGMSEEQMGQLNQRLAEPPEVDVAAFRLMGLAVVSRLAARYGIRVELRANIEGGTVAQVTLPSNIVVLPSRSQTLRTGAHPQIGGPSGGWEAIGGRSATATLPALSPQPWQQENESQSAHPSLPMFPSQRPAVAPPAPPAAQPLATPDRPPLPSRQVKPITAGPSTMNGFSQNPAVTTQLPAPAAYSQPTAFQQPAALPPATQQPFSPQRYDAPSSPDPNGWGAALAAMPPVPAPPMPVPTEERNDAPIFVEMQQSWFRNHGAGQEEFGMPTAGYAPPPNSAVTNPTQQIPIHTRSSTASAPDSRAQESWAPESRAQESRAQESRFGAASAFPAAPASPAVAPSSPAPAAPTSGASVQNGSVPRQRPAAEEKWRTAADDGWQRAMAAAEPVDAGTTRSGLPKRVPQAQLVPGSVDKGDSRAQNRRTPDEVRGLLSAYHRGVQRGRTDGSAENATAPHAKENQQ